MREIAFDTETTGLDPASGHRIVEIGCVEMVDKVRTGRSFQRYFNPERDVPPEAERVHGLSTAFLKDKPLFAEAVEDFLDFIGDAPLVIHNAAFDMKFLNFELNRLGFPPFDMKRATDTVDIARRKFPGSPANLDALCRRFNVDLSSRTKHGALLDAELLADVYLELSGGRQAAIFFDAPAQVVLHEEEAQANVAVPLREFSVSAEELAAHSAFIGGMKNAVWNRYSEESNASLESA